MSFGEGTGLSVIRGGWSRTPIDSARWLEIDSSVRCVVPIQAVTVNRVSQRERIGYA